MLRDRENGAVIEPNDPVWGDLVAVAKRARRTIESLAGDAPVLRRPRRQAGLRRCAARWLGTIWADGIEAAMKAYLSGPQPG
ncbi:MAG: hypothetical protein R3D80_18605 [Paracoccaceae bacterium]